MGFIKKIIGAEERIDRLKELTSLCDECNANLSQLKKSAEDLYNLRKQSIFQMKKIGEKLTTITSLPEWVNEDYNQSLSATEDFQLAIQYEEHPELFAEQTDTTGRAKALLSAGVATGSAVAAFGSTAAMSLATVIGTASTGTAVSALTGAAATNAALAWLGGGAVAAGGAGVAGGNLVLSLFGPIGIAIAGISTIGGFFAIRSKNRKLINELLVKIDEIKKGNEELSKQLDHLSSIIIRSKNFTKNKFNASIIWINDNDKPNDYSQWNDEQKHELEKLINNVMNMAILINERI